MQNNYKCFIYFLLKTVLSVLTLSYLKTSELRRKNALFSAFLAVCLSCLSFFPYTYIFFDFLFFIFLFFFKINIVKKLRQLRQTILNSIFMGFQCLNLNISS